MALNVNIDTAYSAEGCDANSYNGTEEITTSSVILRGELTDLGPVSAANVWFEVVEDPGTAFNPNDETEWENENPIVTSKQKMEDVGTFSDEVTGLKAGCTRYFFKAKAEGTN